MTEPTEERRAHLRESIERLTAPEVEVVDDFVTTLTTDIPSDVNRSSWLATAQWVEAFSTRLRAHHALAQEPLSREQFEAAFNKACSDDGWQVDPATSATHRFFDTTIQKEGKRHRLSLKASSAKDMSRKSIHISKLTEAAWIQDVRRQADRRREIVNLFTDYRKATDSILILRGFRKTGSVEYELVEIPTRVFAEVDSLSVAEAQAATINIPSAAEIPDFKIRVDRSDAKITLTGVRLDVCTVHGRWTLEGAKL